MLVVSSIRFVISFGVILAPFSCAVQAGIEDDVPIYMDERKAFAKLKPVHYDILLNLVNGSKVTGKVTMRIQCLGETDEILLHSENMEITSTRVKEETESSDASLVENWKLGEPELTYLQIKLKEMMVPNKKYMVDIGFTYGYSEENKGLKKTPNQDYSESGLLTTNVKPVYARRIYPCFDVPWIKTTFKLTLVTKKNYEVKCILTSQKIHKLEHLWPWKTSQVNKGLKTTMFHISNKATYELDFIVYNPNITQSDSTLWTKGYRFIDRKNFGGWQMLTMDLDVYWLTAQSTNLASPNVLNLFDPENGKRIPGNKSLSVVLGQEFQDTESYFTWEFMTVKTMDFLHKKGSNVLIPFRTRSWSYAWLIDGLRTFIEYHNAAEYFNETEKLMEMFVVSKQMKAMSMDEGKFAINLEERADSTPKIIKKFSESYSIKGAAFFRTLYLTTDRRTFYEKLDHFMNIYNDNDIGVSSFMDDFSKNTTSALGDICRVFKTWTSQPGYQVVLVEKIERKNIVLLRFKLAKNRTKSWVPVKVFVEGFSEKESNEIRWLKPIPGEDILDIRINRNTECFAVNYNYFAYFRVLYDDSTLEGLIKCLNSKKRILIPPLSRAQIVDDAFYFFKRSLLPKSEYSFTKPRYLDASGRFKMLLDLISTFSHETDLIPWMALEEHLKYIQSLFFFRDRDKDGLNWFLDFKRRLIKEFFDHVLITHQLDVKKHDSQVVRSTRMFAFKMACAALLPECIQQIRLNTGSHVTRFLYQDKYVHRDLQYIVYCNIIADCDYTGFESVLLRFFSDKSDATRLVTAESLACLKQENTVLFALNFLFMKKHAPFTREQSLRILKRFIGNNEYTYRYILFQTLPDYKHRLKEIIGVDGIKAVLEALIKHNVLPFDTLSNNLQKLVTYFVSSRTLSTSVDYEFLKRLNDTIRQNTLVFSNVDKDDFKAHIKNKVLLM